MRAPFIGGPLDGQLVEVPNGRHVYELVKPSEPMMWVTEPIEPMATISIERGHYRLGWWNPADGRAPYRAWEWQGWDDERRGFGIESVRGSVPEGWTRPSPAMIRPMPHLSDEPGPDAMRWTPDVADAEIEAWQQILHPITAGADADD